MKRTVEEWEKIKSDLKEIKLDACDEVNGKCADCLLATYDSDGNFICSVKLVYESL